MVKILDSVSIDSVLPSRVNQKVYLFGSVTVVWGWVKSALDRKPRNEKLEFRKFLREYQWRALLLGEEMAREGLI
jgi:hypothetical protein